MKKVITKEKLDDDRVKLIIKYLAIELEFGDFVENPVDLQPRKPEFLIEIFKKKISKSRHYKKYINSVLFCMTIKVCCEFNNGRYNADIDYKNLNVFKKHLNLLNDLGNKICKEFKVEFEELLHFSILIAGDILGDKDQKVVKDVKKNLYAPLVVELDDEYYAILRQNNIA